MHSDSAFQESTLREHSKNLGDRYFLMRLHPRKIIFDTVGAIWAAFFLWNHNWPAALLIFLVMEGLGLYFARNIDPELMAQTTLGRIGLLHKHPVNLTLNLIGLTIVVYGLWLQAGEMILGGLTLIVLGHFFGWPEVDSRFRSKYRTY